MKKYIFILSIILLLSACGSKTNTENLSAEEKTPSLKEYSFKVEGLNDSVVADSIWKMIFNIEGIDQMNISLNDSMVLIKADYSLINTEMLSKEIESRGGIVVE